MHQVGSRDRQTDRHDGRTDERTRRERLRDSRVMALLRCYRDHLILKDFLLHMCVDIIWGAKQKTIGIGKQVTPAKTKIFSSINFQEQVG